MIKNNYDTIVIGAGAGGLFFGAAAPIGSDILILEKTNKVGTKLLMAGAGQCNLTHAGSIKEFLLCYGKKGKKLRSTLFKHNNIDMMDFFKELGVEVFSREDGKIFPKSLESHQVRDALLSSAAKNSVTIRTDSPVTEIHSQSTCFEVLCGNKKYFCKNLVVATGGASYPTTGSDGSMYEILQKDLGISIIDPRPALAPITVQNYPFSELSGISFHHAAMKIIPADINACGDLLLTFKGLSGPLILNNSRYIHKGNCRFVKHMLQSTKIIF